MGFHANKISILLWSPQEEVPLKEEHCYMTSLAHILRIFLFGFCGVGCSRCHHRLTIGHVGRHSEGALSLAQNR